MVYLCIATFVLLILGLIYAWSIFAVPLGVEFGWDRSLLSQIYAVSMICFCFGQLMGSQIIRMLSLKLTILTAGVLLALGFLATALLAHLGIWVLYVFYGLFASFGCGIGYNAIVSTVNLWFPDRVGLSAGVLMMGFGLGSLIFGSLANSAMTTFGWASAFIGVAVIGAVAMTVLSFVITLPPQSLLDLKVGDEQTTRQDREHQTITASALATPVFYLYALWATIIIAFNTTLMGDARAGAEAVGVDPLFATLLVGLISVTNGISRVIIGAIYDRAGIRFVMLLSTGVALLTSAGLTLAFILVSPFTYYVAAIVFGFVFGSVPVIASAFARETFPAKDFSRNLALVNFNIATGAFLSVVVINLARSLGGDAAIYATFFCLLLIALTTAFLFNRKQKQR